MKTHINDKVSIQFDFSEEKGEAQYFIFKEWRVTFKLPPMLVADHLRVNQQLYTTINQEYSVDYYDTNIRETSFLITNSALGSFDGVEEMEQAIHEKAEEILPCLESIKYPYQITLIIDGFYLDY